MTKKLILRGEIGAIHFSDILTFLNIIKKTGLLETSSGEIKKSVYWEKGEIVFAKSNDPYDSLGHYLVRNGKISEEQHLEAGKNAKEDQKLGKVLVQRKMISPQELWWGVKNQVLDIIYSLFGWTSGVFTFYITEESPEEKITLKTSTSNLIMEGIRRLDEWKRIREQIPSNNVIPVVLEKVDPASPEVVLNELEKLILSKIDGEKNVKILVRESRSDEFTVNSILYSLFSAGLIEIKDREAPLEQVEAETTQNLMFLLMFYNTIFRKLYELLIRKIGDVGKRLFGEILGGNNLAKDPVLAGVGFDESGRLDESLLLANVTALPAKERIQTLNSTLEVLLEEQLKNLDDYLDEEDRKMINDVINSERKKIEVMLSAETV